MKKLNYLIVIIVTIVLVSTVINFQVFAQKQEKSILIINSHTEDYAWTRDVIKGIFKIINPSEFDIDIYVENFDYKYYRRGNIEEDIYKLIKREYRDKKIDLVITTDLRATEFAINYQEKLFKDIPIVFSGLSKIKAEEITKGVDNITGVIEKLNIKETLKTAFNVTPDAKEVYVIHDNTSRGIDSFEEIKNIVAGLDNEVEVKTFGKIGDIKSDISLPDIGKNGILIGTICLEDENGMEISMSEVAGKISREVNIPVFYLQEAAIEHGVIGGSMFSTELHGKNTGEVVLRVLRGDKPSDIGLVEKNNSKEIYDYNVLKKYHISEDLLPKNSEIIKME